MNEDPQPPKHEHCRSQNLHRATLFDVDLANTFLLANDLDLIADLVPESHLMRNCFDNDQRRRAVRSIELDVFYAAKPVSERLLRLDVLYPIQLKRVGHFAENTFIGFQSFGG